MSSSSLTFSQGFSEISLNFWHISFRFLADSTSMGVVGYILDRAAQVTSWANHIYNYLFGFLEFCIIFSVANMD